MLNTASGEQNKHFLQRPLHLNSSKTLLIKKKKAFHPTHMLCSHLNGANWFTSALKIVQSFTEWLHLGIL